MNTFKVGVLFLLGMAVFGAPAFAADCADGEAGCAPKAVSPIGQIEGDDFKDCTKKVEGSRPKPEVLVETKEKTGEEKDSSTTKESTKSK